MRIHVVCRAQRDSILERKARVLAEHTGWTMSKAPDPSADLNYAFPYLELRNDYKGEFAGYFTHREDVIPTKARIWKRQAERAALRITSARQYEADLQQYGPTVRILPPLDRDKFQPGPRIPRSRPTAGVSGYVYAGGRKGEQLLRDVLQTSAGQGFDWTAAGKGWPVPVTHYTFERLHEFYQSLDVYVCTSLIEGVPYGPIESLACGVPVIIPRGVGLLDDLPEIEGIHRYVKGSREGLAEALRAARDSRPDPDELRAATEPFTVEAWVDGHVQAFRDLLQPEPMRTDRGVYVVAYGANARTCATRLLASIRRFMPGIPVAVCSESPLPGADRWVEGTSELRGRVAKTSIYDWAPSEWRYVLYLDADTELVDDPSHIWGVLESGYELAMHDSSPLNKVRHNRRRGNVEEMRETIALVGSPDAIGVAGGVFAFRRCPNALRLFSTWQREYLRYRNRHDQPSLVRAVYSVPEANVYWLDSAYNRFTKHEKPGDPVIIRHWSGGPARVTGNGVGNLPGYKKRSRRIVKLRVTNNQRYALGRRGYVFPPGETVEIEVASESAYREIKAARYLDVKVLGREARAVEPTPQPDAEPEQSGLADLTVRELRLMAARHGVDVPAGTRKAELVQLIEQAKVTNAV